ncbi:MAG: TerB family tellurite resistance protein [Cyclobacteriaceae bacterium]
MSNIETHLKSMIELAMSDQSFDKVEEEWIYSIGKMNGIDPEVIDNMIKKQASAKTDLDISFDSLTYTEKFEYLYNILQLMKVDSKVFLTEIKYCELLASKLGYDPKVVKKLSSRIYSDPSIRSNMALLEELSQKYLK